MRGALSDGNSEALNNFIVFTNHLGLLYQAISEAFTLDNIDTIIEARNKSSNPDLVNKSINQDPQKCLKHYAAKCSFMC